MYMLDKQFLYELDNHPIKEIYVKLVVLNNQEQPLESLEGRATGGSISVDGSSAVRRTCNLTIATQNMNINQYYWGLENKFTVEIGVANTINKNYPNIIWFKQGTYFITQFNTSSSTNNYTISISGKDKMCKLNGDIGGNLPASIDFGKEEITDEENNITISPIPLKRVITELIHAWAEEPYENILVNDLDDMGVELLENRSDATLYMFRNANTGQVLNVTFDPNIQVYIDNTTQVAINDNRIIPYDNGLKPEQNATIVTFKPNGTGYHILKKQYGETVGYRATELVFAGELISSIGETITSMLDKIIKMLGDFEYFYDLYGRFVFQKKKTYLNTSWNPIVKDSVTQESYVDPLNSLVSYTFEGNNLITAISHNPNLQNLRNDFTIWGKKNRSGNSVPIHARFALDRKPTKYVSYDDNIYIAGEDVGQFDWRELIYQMAIDYRRYNHQNEVQFLQKIAKNNPESCPKGYTGYEKYYTDMEGFWRLLYNPNPSEEDKEQYREDHWNVNVTTDPASLDFWFDFIDTNGDLDKYSIPNIGDRPKVINESTVTGIYFEETPTIIFVKEFNKEEHNNSGYTYVQFPELEDALAISAQGISAKDKMDELLYNHSYCVESISLTAIPIYYLEPNTLIKVFDEKSNIDGNYIVSKITVPLTYNGTMSISATKAPKRFI